MTHNRTGSTRVSTCLIATGAALASASVALAENIVLTGHDILLHQGQSGYDQVILDYLRNSTEPAGTYTIGVIGSGVGYWAFTPGGSTPAGGYPAATFYSTTALDGNAALQAGALSNDVLIIVSHTSCGGCDLTTSGSDVINSQMANGIATAFNAGMDLWVNAGADLTTYYDFLPPSFVATGTAITGTTFCATTAGAGIGVVPGMTTGYPTHNRFSSYSSTLGVLETDCPMDVGTDVITLGAQNITIPQRRVCVNKDLRNDTGNTANDVEILVEGAFASTLSTFNGGFTNFTITPVGPNTQLRWSGMSVADGGVAHVGACLAADEVKILGVFWTFDGSAIGCAPQCNSLYGTHSSGSGTLTYENNVTDCSAQVLYTGNLSVEYYGVVPPDLADMVPGGVRNPIKVDAVPGKQLIPVGGVAQIPELPAPPAHAEYSLLVFDVAADPSLAAGDETRDFVLTRIATNVPVSTVSASQVPALTRGGAILLVVVFLGLTIAALWRRGLVT